MPVRARLWEARPAGRVFFEPRPTVRACLQSIRQNLFQPFVSSGKEKGIGLGLTVVQEIMQNHGGEVCVESTGPQGTVFKLTFLGAISASRPTTA
jgi:K+-sensing histidine kinase KdpD